MTVRVGARSLLALAMAAGCTYPEFQFSGTDHDGAAAEDSADDLGAEVAEIDALIDAPSEETTVFDATFDAETDASDVAIDTRDAAIDTRDAALDTRDAATDTRDAATDTRDAADAFDATPVRFCNQAAHFFCNDFDASTLVDFGWSGFGEFGGGALSLQSTSTSSPRALRVIASPMTGATDVGAYVARVLTAPSVASVARFEADVQVDAATYSGGTMVLLKLQRSGGRGTLLSIGPTGLQAEMIGAGSAYKLVGISKTVTAGVWFHVRIDTTLRVSGGTMKVWIDGTQYIDEANVSTAEADDTFREAIVGLYALPPLLAFSARMDSVTVDFSP